MELLEILHRGGGSRIEKFDEIHEVGLHGVFLKLSVHACTCVEKVTKICCSFPKIYIHSCVIDDELLFVK